MFVFPDALEIKKRREALGLSQCKLSLAAELPCNAIMRIERGDCKKTSHLRAESIARALGCTVDDICEAPADKKVG